MSTIAGVSSPTRDSVPSPRLLSGTALVRVFAVAAGAAFVVASLAWLAGWPQAVFQALIAAEFWSLVGLSYAKQTAVKSAVAVASIWTALVIVEAVFFG